MLSKIIGIVFLGLLIITGFSMCGSYNTAVGKEEGVKQAWSQVENVYQRRADLIPNLVEIVKGYAKHESTTLSAVIQARASATQIKVDASNLTPEAIAQFQQAQGGLSQSLGRLLAVAEAYPDLKANQNFLQLQNQLEGTENRIAQERKKFNEAVNGYNSYIRLFPTNLLVGIFGFSPKGYFQADEAAKTAPKIQF